MYTVKGIPMTVVYFDLYVFGNTGHYPNHTSHETHVSTKRTTVFSKYVEFKNRENRSGVSEKSSKHRR